MKRSCIAAMILLLTAASASAATLATYTHNYGNGAGQVDPAGQDALGNGYVTVLDTATTTGYKRFADSFDFSAVHASSISQFNLTLTYTGVGAYVFGLGEKWSVRPGGTTSYSAFNLPSGNGSQSASQTFTITSSTDTFSAMAASKNFFFWLAEDTIGADSFKLSSATLSITGAVPEPESYALFVAGLGLIGTMAYRRRN